MLSEIQETFWNWSGWVSIGAIAAMVAAIATVLYTWFTYHLLSATKESIDIANSNREVSNKLAEFQIYSKVTDLLSSSEALKIFDAIESGNFYVEELMTEQEKVNPDSSKIRLQGKDIRRYILSPIEDLAKFKEDGLLSLDTIDSGFGNTILMVGNSRNIFDYVKYLRARVYYSENILNGFQTLYSEILACCSDEEQKKYMDIRELG